MTHDPSVAHLLPANIRTGVHPDEAFALENMAYGRLVLEFGSQLGFSTIVMARVAARVVAVDWHRGDAHAGRQDTLGAYFTNLEREGLRDKVITIVGRFEDVGAYLAPVFGAGFIDGFHDYTSTIRDLDVMAPRVTGQIAVHDYDRELGGVPFETKPAVDDWLAAHPEWRKIKLVSSLFVMERVA